MEKEVNNITNKTKIMHVVADMHFPYRRMDLQLLGLLESYNLPYVLKGKWVEIYFVLQMDMYIYQMEKYRYEGTILPFLQ